MQDIEELLAELKTWMGNVPLYMRIEMAVRELRERADKTTQSEIAEQARLIRERDALKAKLATTNCPCCGENLEMEADAQVLSLIVERNKLKAKLESKDVAIRPALQYLRYVQNWSTHGPADLHAQTLADNLAAVLEEK